ncbi:MAG: hypothetical protein EXR78_10305 [Deltaproteobacteria bacterium]|nr:hypothetical protein [Deltaproteobacteria bacterium]
MRILITNTALVHRSGSELYVRDLALGLLERGHTPLVYSPILGEVAQEIRAATIPVVDHLDKIALSPDLIHGQHHLEMLTALLHFPGVPAIAFCHGWAPWEENPLRFPRILRYVAVDLPCRDRLLFEHGIPEEQIQLLLNFVDLQRFCPRAPLPARPQRALIFSNYATEGTHLPVLREACARLGLKLDVMGAAARTASAQPEKELGQYDLVFAVGRSALEALAIGTAVVLCSPVGVGPLVTVQDLDRLRMLNCGIRTLRMPLTPENLIQQISRYDAQDATEVSRRIRATVGRDAVVDELLVLYQSVLREHHASEKVGADAEEKAVATYLRWVAPTVKAAAQSQYERNQFATRNVLLQQTVTVREEELRATQHTVRTLQEARARQDVEMQRLQSMVTASQQTVAMREEALRATQHTVRALQETMVERNAEMHQLQSTVMMREVELREKQKQVRELRKTAEDWEAEGRRMADWQRRARALVAGLDSLRHSRTIQFLRRFSPERDLQNALAPAFRSLKHESAGTMSTTNGFRLQPGINLQRVPFVAYPLAVTRTNLRGVRLAPVFDLPVLSGWIGIEIVSLNQQLLAQGRLPCAGIDEHLPMTVEFSPHTEIRPGRYWLRVSVRDVDGPVRLLEWRRYRFFGCGSLQTRACCGLVFSL